MMIVTQVENVYETTLPAEVRQLLYIVQFTITLGITGMKDVLQCMGFEGFLSRLGFWMIMPAALVCAISIATLATIVCVRWGELRHELDNVPLAEQSVHLFRTMRSERREFAKRLLLAALPPVIRSLFIIYPLVTNTAFEAFSCYKFDHDRFSVLVADVSITCTTDGVATADWRNVQNLAVLAICLYPVGLLVITGTLLFHERRAIRARRPTPLSEAIRFLYDEYEPWAYWWEVCGAISNQISPRSLVCLSEMCAPAADRDGTSAGSRGRDGARNARQCDAARHCNCHVCRVCVLANGSVAL
jgi:hypothetical protein